MIIVRHRRLGLDVPLSPLTAAAAACFRESAAASPLKDLWRRKSPRPSRFASRFDRSSTMGDDGSIPFLCLGVAGGILSLGYTFSFYTAAAAAALP